MKTKTEVQITLDSEERDKIHYGGIVLRNIVKVMAHCNDYVTFRCWDQDHDYKEYDFKFLSDCVMMLSDILYAEEIGFNHQEREQND